ncbi:MAG: hypothetical protein F9K19_04740 [Rhizobiaceae bacterium]|nr:MAG: hypothetical protein F9K19_04740 [Rhizobiaceae bacterium]CAG0966341.1 hypothetical protein RHIZO_00981 [Rhizobiaceae bacterium]
MRSRIAAILAGLFFAGHAAAADLKDGSFTCYLGSMVLGQIELEAGMFRGPAFDGNFEGDYPFEVTASGTVNWGGPLGGLSSDGNTVVSTVLKKAGDRIGFDITVQNARGNFQTISCYPD